MKLSLLDKLCLQVDQVLQTLSGANVQLSTRDNPAASVSENGLTQKERTHAAGLMRVNHAGEVSAQALYQGQSLTARLPGVRDKMNQAAQEEVDHLAWCQSRIHELGSHTSRLNPIWYAGSFAIGALAGAIGDKWSLGFVAETEKQVVKHLNSHMQELPESDHKSQAIVKQMRDDEEKHQHMAMDAGAAELPPPVKKIMNLVSKVMTKTAYRL